MSPLAITLFALACTALSSAYGSSCSDANIGPYTAMIISLPRYVIPAGQRETVINVPDNCKLKNWGKLVGEDASACDNTVAPDVKMSVTFSPVTVRRSGALDDGAYVDMTQYCG